MFSVSSWLLLKRSPYRRPHSPAPPGVPSGTQEEALLEGFLALIGQIVTARIHTGWWVLLVDLYRCGQDIRPTFTQVGGSYWSICVGVVRIRIYICLWFLLVDLYRCGQNTTKARIYTGWWFLLVGVYRCGQGIRQWFLFGICVIKI